MDPKTLDVACQAISDYKFEVARFLKVRKSRPQIERPGPGSLQSDCFAQLARVFLTNMCLRRALSGREWLSVALDTRRLP